MVDLQTFPRQLGDNFLDRGRFVELDEFGAPPNAVCLRERGLSVAERQQLLLHLGVEQIQVEVRFVKFPNGFFVVEIVHGLIVALANFHQIGRQFAGFGIPVFQVRFEIATVPPHHLAQLREFLE